eukprot:8760236-Pyramimonas_sp.AAC.1
MSVPFAFVAVPITPQLVPPPCLPCPVEACVVRSAMPLRSACMAAAAIRRTSGDDRNFPIQACKRWL